MLRSSASVAEIREMLLRILAISAQLAGFCVAGIGPLNAHSKGSDFVGLGDDLLAIAARGFL